MFKGEGAKLFNSLMSSQYSNDGLVQSPPSNHQPSAMEENELSSQHQPKQEEPNLKSILVKPTVELLKPIELSDNTTEFLMLTL